MLTLVTLNIDRLVQAADPAIEVLGLLDEIEEEMDEEFEIADKERDQIISMLEELKQEIASLKAERSD